MYISFRVANYGEIRVRSDIRFSHPTSLVSSHYPLTLCHVPNTPIDLSCAIIGDIACALSMHPVTCHSDIT